MSCTEHIEALLQDLAQEGARAQVDDVKGGQNGDAVLTAQIRRMASSSHDDELSWTDAWVSWNRSF